MSLLSRLEAAPERAWRTADIVAIVLLVFFLFYYLTAFRFDVLFTTEARWVDFRQWYLFPPLVAENLSYPAVVWNDWTKPFPYLPSALILLRPLSLFSEPVAFAIWLAIQSLAFAAVIRTGLVLSGALAFRAPYVIAAAAVLLSENALGWDFRTHNNNVVYLALVMLGLAARSVWAGGILLAVSANLKIYSGVLLPLFAWRREYRLATTFAIASALIAVVLPVIAFGPVGFFALLKGWVAQALYLSPVAHDGFPPDLLRRSIALVLSESKDSPTVGILLRAAQCAWLLVVAGYFWLAARSPATSDSRARLADVCVVLLAPLPFSVWFVPYHSVVVLPAHMLMLAVLMESRTPQTVRAVLAAALVTGAMLAASLPQWELRAGKSVIGFVVVVAALGCLRRGLAQAQNDGSQRPAEPRLR